MTLGYFLTGDTTLRATLRTSGVEFSESRERLLPLLSEAAGETAASTLLRRVMDFYVLAEGQIGLRDEQSRTLMRRTPPRTFDGLGAALLRTALRPPFAPKTPSPSGGFQVALEMQIQMNAMAKALGTYLVNRRGTVPGTHRRSTSEFLALPG